MLRERPKAKDSNCGAYTLRPPRWRAQERLPTVTVFAVLAREEHPPAGIPAIEWLLLSTVPVTDFDAACERVEWYACRWMIELYHKVLKSGCRIEERQFENAEPIERYLAIDSVVAWRVLGLTFQSREMPDLSGEAFLEPDEWKALFCYTQRRKTPPPKPPTLKDAALWIAKL
ncbi:MAG TPA: IS4 family transposase, partial [Saprospiraceae bacterium]|nr:IS4 family transposase [Saprospiraceae bacterium]